VGHGAADVIEQLLTVTEHVTVLHVTMEKP
jgi:hypothetical protein